VRARIMKEAQAQPSSGYRLLDTSPQALAAQYSAAQEKIARGAKLLSELKRSDIEISLTPKDEIWRNDSVVLYRYRPEVERPLAVPVLIAYALIGRYQMIDLEFERSFVRKLLAQGLDVYVIDWGLPKRYQRWHGIDDYVNGYLDDCVDAVREKSGASAINLLGICQGGVFCLCYAALHPEKVKNLIVTVTPVDFHADVGSTERGSGYVNRWMRASREEDVDRMIDAWGNYPGGMMGFAFLLMNPIDNITKYSSELVGIVGDEEKLKGFLRMERWIADRPDHPGEVLRNWLRDLYMGNRLVKNELRLGAKRVDLRNVTMPVLNVYAQEDVIVPPACSRALKGRCGTSDDTEIEVPGGHIGTFVGNKAQKILGPAITDWLKARV
jgi:poly[(R)-3-hydroxyalkanoate] polymerase subunit PhaC